MKTVSLVTLIAATLTTGLMAGFFTTFSYTVMPALGRTDDRSFIATMQSINKVVINPWFLTSFVGAVVLTIAATVMHWNGEARPALPWVIAGTVLYLVMFTITRGVNIPLNDKLEAAGDPSRIADLAAVRDAFEAKWVAWNIARALASTAAFACLVWALFLHARHTG